MDQRLPIDVRRARSEDAESLAQARVASTVERRPLDAAARATFERDCLLFFSRELAREDSFLHTWVALVDGSIVGSASLLIVPTLPRSNAVFTGFDGRVRDVYVRPNYRRKGIGLALMRAILADAVAADVHQITLGATSMGVPLYQSLGFVAKKDEMILAT